MNLSLTTFEAPSRRRSIRPALLSSKNKPKAAPKEKNILARISETKILTEIQTSTDEARIKMLGIELRRRYEPLKTKDIQKILESNSNITLKKILYPLLASRAKTELDAAKILIDGFWNETDTSLQHLISQHLQKILSEKSNVKSYLISSLEAAANDTSKYSRLFLLIELVRELGAEKYHQVFDILLETKNDDTEIYRKCLSAYLSFFRKKSNKLEFALRAARSFPGNFHRCYRQAIYFVLADCLENTENESQQKYLQSFIDGVGKVVQSKIFGPEKETDYGLRKYLIELLPKVVDADSLPAEFELL